jgi:hypothetical protein
MVGDDAAPLNSFCFAFWQATEAQCGVAVVKTLIECKA